MRKYDKKNKNNIGIILGVSLVIVIIFSYFVFKMISVSRIEYQVLSGSILYDVDKNMLKLDSDGKIKIKWNSKYYLLYNDDNYLLGNNSVVYTPSNGNISLYGRFYEIKDDATVEIKDNETKLESSVISRFYKISDRKYLLISSSIYTDNKELDTNNYLIVELDKLGNATLYNNEVNLKTFNETSIITNDYIFDIANEILIYGDNKIDLKKIIGSTNEYMSKDILVDENTDVSDENNDVNDDQNNNVVNNTTTYQSNTNNGDSSNNDIVKENIQVSKRTSVIRVVPSMTSISIDYVVYDPNDEYNSIYVDIVNQSNNTSTLVYLNKKNTNISISNLSPNTKYRLYFNYTYYEDDGLKTYNYNTVDVTTKAPIMSISLSNITSDNIDYVINLDDNYNINSATIDLLLDGDLVDRYQINDVGYVSSFNGSIDVSNYNLENGIVTVRLSNIVFDGNGYNTNVYYKFKY